MVVIHNGISILNNLQEIVKILQGKIKIKLLSKNTSYPKLKKVHSTHNCIAT